MNKLKPATATIINLNDAVTKAKVWFTGFNILYNRIATPISHKKTIKFTENPNRYNVSNSNRFWAIIAGLLQSIILEHTKTLVKSPPIMKINYKTPVILACFLAYPLF